MKGYKQTQKVEWFKFLEECKGEVILSDRKKFENIHRVTSNTLKKWHEEWKERQGIRGFDLKDFIKTHAQEVAEALIKTATTGKNANALRLLYQLSGDLVEKQEVDVKIGLSADEIARIRREADSELERFRAELSRNQGMGEVQKELCLLPDEIREDK